MAKNLNDLTNQGIVRIEHVEDYVQLKLENGSTISIFNRYTTSTEKIDEVVGAIITKIDQNKHMVSITLDSNAIIGVSLDENDFSGPEAMLYTDAEGRSIVWQ